MSIVGTIELWSMLKMIIKNCPSCFNGEGCTSSKTTSTECKPNMCIMKQIVYALKTKPTELNEKILNLLDIS
jgi:hypothetical protein